MSQSASANGDRAAHVVGAAIFAVVVIHPGYLFGAARAWPRLAPVLMPVHEALALKLAVFWAGAAAVWTIAISRLISGRGPRLRSAGLVAASSLTSLVGLTWLSLMWTSTPQAALSRGFETALLLGWALGAAVIAAEGGTRSARTVAGWWAAAGAVSAVAGMLVGGLFPGCDGWFGRAFPSGNPNTLAVVLASSAAVAGAALVEQLRSGAPAEGRWWKRTALPALCVFACVARLAQTGSLTGALAAVAGGLALALLLGGRTVRAVACGVALPAAAVVSGLLVRMIANPWSLSGRSTVAVRMHIWRAALRMIAERPWFGHGGGAFGARVGGYIEPAARLNPQLAEPASAHNEIIELAVELGIPGGILAAVAVVAAVASAYGAASTGTMRDRAPMAALLGGLAALVVGALAGPFARLADGGILLFGAIGVAAGAGGVRGAGGPGVLARAQGARTRKAALVVVGVAAAIMWWRLGAAELISGYHATWGRRLFASRDADGAADEFRLAARSSMRCRQRLLQLEWLGRSFADGRDWSSAAEVNERMAEARPYHLPTLRRLGYCRRLSGDLDGALAAVTLAMALAPYSAGLVDECRRGLSEGSLAGARRRIDDLVAERGLAEADRLFLHGLALWGRGRKTEAADALARARPDECILGFVGIHRARLHAEQGDMRMAHHLASRHVRAHPLDAPAFRLHARTGAAVGRPEEEVIASLRRALELNSELPDVAYDLANQLVRFGRSEEALDVLDRHRSLDVHVADQRFVLHARLLVHFGRKGEAETLLRQARDMRPQAAILFAGEQRRLGLDH